MSTATEKKTRKTRIEELLKQILGYNAMNPKEVIGIVQDHITTNCPSDEEIEHVIDSLKGKLIIEENARGWLQMRIH